MPAIDQSIAQSRRGKSLQTSGVFADSNVAWKDPRRAASGQDHGASTVPIETGSIVMIPKTLPDRSRYTTVPALAEATDRHRDPIANATLG